MNAARSHSRARRTLARHLAGGLGLLVAAATLTPLAAQASEAACPTASVRWASTSNTLYVTGAVVCTLSDIDAYTKAPISLVNTVDRIWTVGTNIRLEQGATLALRGTAVGGDANEVRLKSENSADAGSTIEVRAEWGTIDIASTKVTSWDSVAFGPDTETETFGRSYMRARSFLDTSGVARESRMDIVDSDIGYLGAFQAEGYGLTWKVMGTSAGLYDAVGVYGRVVNSHIHHNYFGAYSYGGEAIEFDGNEVDHNIKYGIDPHDDSDRIVITDNFVHDNGDHGIICSQRCNDLRIERNTSTGNVGNGIMLHRQVTSTLVADNKANDNTDTGVAIFDSSGNTVRHNEMLRNSRGVRLSVGAANNVIEDNTIGASTTYGVYTYMGTDVPTSGDGRPKNNTVRNNVISGSGSWAMNLGEADNNTFVGNQLLNNARGIILEQATGNRFDQTDLSAAGVVNAEGGTTPITNTLSRFKSATVDYDASATWVLEDPDGTVFDLPGALGTTITPTGAKATIAPAQAPSPFPAKASSVRASVTSGSAVIDPSILEPAQRVWTTQTGASTVVHYTVADLAPGTAYPVTRNGTAVGSFTAGADGKVVFDSAPGSTAPVTYRLAGAAAPAPGTLTITPEADARVESGSPTTNFGAATTVVADTSPATESFLRFRVDGVTAPIDKATLRLYVTDSSSNGPALYASGATWSESTINWNNKPARTGTAIGDLGSISSGKYVEYDVKSAITGNGLFSFNLVGTSSDGADFSSKEAATNRPQLVISFAGATPPPPPVPTTVKVAAAADAEVRTGSSTNRGTATSLQADSSPVATSYVRFTVGTLATPVTKAVLRVYSSSSTADGPAVYPTATGWSETTVNWNNKPARTGGVLGDKGAISSGQWVEYDVTALVTGAGTYSLELFATSSDSVTFRSREASSNKPELVITTS